jgi:hypothetical protein
LTTPNDTSQAFIIRIWVEQREIKDAEPVWRGVIEFINNNESVYFNNLEQIGIHLAPFITAMGAKVEQP